MSPDAESAKREITDPGRVGAPRAWESAVVLARELGESSIRAESSAHHRSSGYQVGVTMAPFRPLSKLFALPGGLSDASVLRDGGALDLLRSDPTVLDHDDRVLLHACVVVTLGAARASLVDTQRGRLYLAPIALGQILERHRGSTIREILAAEPDVAPADASRWMGTLVACELATVIDEPAENFPPIELAAAATTMVQAAVVDVAAHSDHDLRAIVGELDELGCEHLELRYVDVTAPAIVREQLTATSGSRLRTVHVIAPWTPAWTEPVIDQLCDDFARLALLTLHGAPESATLGDHRYQAALVSEPLADHRHCGQVHPLYFGLNLSMVIASRVGDTCLAGKIGIDADGTIRNCPTHPTARGRVGATRLADVVTTAAFLAPGSVTKADVDGCRVCEFRSVCSHCQVQAANPGAKPDTCRYDPKTGRWT